jgi:hypothetical protein
MVELHKRPRQTVAVSCAHLERVAAQGIGERGFDSRQVYQLLVSSNSLLTFSGEDGNSKI